MAVANVRRDGGPFAALVVKDGIVIATGTNQVTRGNDPTAHAEIVAIREACRVLGDFQLTGCDLYASCEPCPMCMSCCLWARADRVVYGATVADAAKYGHQILIPSAEVQQRSDMACVVTGPVERDRCLELFTHPAMQAMFKKWKEAGP